MQRDEWSIETVGYYSYHLLACGDDKEELELIHDCFVAARGQPFASFCLYAYQRSAGKASCQINLSNMRPIMRLAVGTVVEKPVQVPFTF